MDVAPSSPRQPASLSSLAPRSPTPSTGPDICIVCLQPSAVVIREKRKGTHPPAGHVVGLTPEQCRQDFNSSLSWSIMQWQCTECSHVTWFSYHFFHDVYDGRWHGKHESPTQLARRAQEKGTLQGWPERQAKSQSHSASPEAPSRPKRPRIDTGSSAPRLSNTPPQSTTSINAAHSLAASSPFIIAPSQAARLGLGDSSMPSEYSRVYDQSSQSVSPAALPLEKIPIPAARIESRSGSRVQSRRPSMHSRRRSSRHERHLSNVQEESRPHAYVQLIPADSARRDAFDTRSPSVGSHLPQSAQPISPPRSATESRPISAGVSEDFEPGDPNERHHRRGSNFDLDNFNRIRRFGACEWCRKRKKRCSISHHIR